MKKAIIIVIAILLAGFIFGKAYGQEAEQQCPAGSYSIGENKNGDLICKLEPTGCPYGDSIPLGPDCDKHAPQKVQEPSAPLEPYYGAGK